MKKFSREYNLNKKEMVKIEENMRILIYFDFSEEELKNDTKMSFNDLGDKIENFIIKKLNITSFNLTKLKEI